MDLANEVFDAMVERFAGRVEDIYAMARTSNSFELWCSWEAFLACQRVTGWAVLARPRYADFDVPGSRDEGDLAVMARLPDGGERWVFTASMLHAQRKHRRHSRWNGDHEPDTGDEP
jgi:hypothetical protein